MNENLNLVEILKDCHEGTKLYSPIIGEVEFKRIKYCEYPIVTCSKNGNRILSFTKEGLFFSEGECIMLFPSKEQRDWSKFNPKKPKFDPNTLQPFDKVLVRNCDADKWKCAHFSYMEPSFMGTIYVTSMLFRDRVHYNDNCIPYNDDTKHLVGTTDEAPEFYRYWEDRNYDD